MKTLRFSVQNPFLFSVQKPTRFSQGMVLPGGHDLRDPAEYWQDVDSFLFREAF